MRGEYIRRADAMGEITSSDMRLGKTGGSG